MIKHGNFLIQSAGLSDRGLKRGHNEDSLSVVPDIGLYIVADGMGGHNAGEVASRMAIESMVDYVRTHRGDVEVTLPYSTASTLNESETTLVTAVKLANRDVCNLALEHPEYQGMGTTLVSMYLNPEMDQISIAHVGDSRCYLMRGGKLSQITVDHSWVSEQLQKKIITPEEAKNHRWKNVITRALGNRIDVDVDIQTRDIMAGDLYLLCSDGLSSMIEDDAIERVVLEYADLEECINELIAAANAAGGLDNISVIMVRVLSDSSSRISTGVAPDETQ